jgi:hypothetical protein
MNRFWNSAFRSLLLVRLGQELGSESELAQTVAGVLDAAIKIIGHVVG